MNTAPDLISAQRALQAGIFGGAAQTVSALLQLNGSTDASAGDRLGIYAHAYRARLIEVLCNDYPVLRRLLGDEAFDDLGRRYTDAYPSSTPSARWFGRHLADFLAGDEPLLAELARFEWAQGEVFDAVGEPPIAIAELAGILPEQWGNMRFRFGAPMCRLRLLGNAPEIVQAHGDDDAATPLPSPAAAEVRDWLIWRRDLSIHWRPLADDESRALDLMIGDGDFAALCERLDTENSAGEAPAKALQLLARWCQEQLITAILLSADSNTLRET